MIITVYLARERKEKTIELNQNSTVQDLVKRLNLTVQGAVVLRDGLPVLEEERLIDGERLIVVQTASGG
ncbi:MoaD/ThiS family protein [Metallosphaera hakonensis]|uniref:Thiamine biosynthesis protein ThiS n=1 Tax=Metallosphaera hakonensis JCM 8857 = DSM 7519 TaxID=1293036 RepID=A0A2U9IXB1_9CREN|nr:MoaD/ThiS family protein [Metallosphaera hakonensis]AWS00729.1 thiamine biosynthesis protein ThiS [Metallosphaera hakonensis JCM 8857 = DSM 7519]